MDTVSFGSKLAADKVRPPKECEGDGRHDEDVPRRSALIGVDGTVRRELEGQFSSQPAGQRGRRRSFLKAAVVSWMAGSVARRSMLLAPTKPTASVCW